MALRSEFLRDIDWRINVSGASIGIVSVDIGSFVSKAISRMKEIERAQKLITVDPEIMGGTPVFAGTRVPVDTVMASLKKGIDRERILSAYSTLTDKHLEAARVYSEVYLVEGARPNLPVRRYPGRLKAAAMCPAIIRRHDRPTARTGLGVL